MLLTILCYTQYNSRMNVKPSPNQAAKFQMEMRRGALVLAVLSQLDEPQYGYSLKKRLIEQGLEIDEGGGRYSRRTLG